MRRTIKNIVKRVPTSIEQVRSIGSTTRKSFGNQLRGFYYDAPKISLVTPVKKGIDYITELINKKTPISNIRPNLNNTTKSNRTKYKTGYLYDILKFLHRLTLFQIFFLFMAGLGSGFMIFIKSIDKDELLKIAKLLPEKIDITETASESSYIYRNDDGKYYFSLRLAAYALIRKLPSSKNVGINVNIHSVKVEAKNIEELLPLLNDTSHIYNYKYYLESKEKDETLTPEEKETLENLIKLETVKRQTEQEMLKYIQASRVKGGNIFGVMGKNQVYKNRSKNITAKLITSNLSNQVETFIKTKLDNANATKAKELQ